MPLTSESYISFERFLNDPSIEEHSEWVDGKVVPMHAVADRHNEITCWLIELLGAYVRRRRLGRIYSEPFVMKTGPDLPGRAADLLFVEWERLGRIRSRHLDGPADLAVEVLSPESRTRDRVHKFAEYERGGVGEYWLIDPVRQQAEFFLPDEKGRYAHSRMDGEGVYHSRRIPGVRLRVDWLWRRPLPDTLDILRQWGAI